MTDVFLPIEPFKGCNEFSAVYKYVNVSVYKITMHKISMTTHNTFVSKTKRWNKIKLYACGEICPIKFKLFRYKCTRKFIKLRNISLCITKTYKTIQYTNYYFFLFYRFSIILFLCIKYKYILLNILTNIHIRITLPTNRFSDFTYIKFIRIIRLARINS